MRGGRRGGRRRHIGPLKVGNSLRAWFDHHSWHHENTIMHSWFLLNYETTSNIGGGWRRLEELGGARSEIMYLGGASNHMKEVILKAYLAMESSYELHHWFILRRRQEDNYPAIKSSKQSTNICICIIYNIYRQSIQQLLSFPSSIIWWCYMLFQHSVVINAFWIHTWQVKDVQLIS